MTHKLNDNLNNHDIRIYSMTSGRMIIGEFISEDSDGIRLSCPLEIKKIQSINGNLAEKMTPFVSGNSSEACIIYHHCIEFEAHTSLSVKQRYAESLIYDRLLALMMSEILNDSESHESSSLEVDSSDAIESDEELWNSFLDRWKNTDV